MTTLSGNPYDGHRRPARPSAFPRVALALVLALALAWPTLAAPTLPLSPNDALDQLYELQYELHRPTGACTVVGSGRGAGLRAVPIGREKGTRQLNKTRAARRSGFGGADGEREGQGGLDVLVEEVEMVRLPEGASSGPARTSSTDSFLALQREREAASNLVTLTSRSSPSDAAALLPILLDIAAGRNPSGVAPPARFPSQSCRTWTQYPSGLERSAGLLTIQDGSDDDSRVWATAASDDDRRLRMNADIVPEGMELYPLRISGPTTNRVNVAFFGDGYTLEERDKFLDDVRSLTDTIVDDGTFLSTAPVFNFWAVFVPSAESGVGSNGRPNQTPFGLYRDGHELRALYAAHRQRARAACRVVREGFFGDQHGGCDHMAIVGNTAYYGGLGGEFTITTASALNGALVLRHEIGHSLSQVGEEYDGGYAYFGVNSSPNYTDVKWAHWLTDPDREPRSEDAATPLQAYPWHDLEAANWSTTFETLGSERYPRSMLRFSVAGLTSADQMIVTLDGAVVPWTIPTKWRGSVDRAWIEIPQPVAGGLSSGSHTLTFALNASAAVAGRDSSRAAADEVVQQICSVEVSEYGQNDVFESREDYIGAFPTRSMYGTTTYRPTNEHCLMRMVGTPRLCSICQEGLWHKLLSQIRLVDAVQIDLSQSSVTIGLQLLPLAHLRPPLPVALPTEVYEVKWSLDGVLRPDLANRSSFNLPRHQARGEWQVRVALHSEEVRKWAADEGMDVVRITL